MKTTCWSRPWIALFDLRAALVKRVAAAIGHWEIQPLHASLIGSFARGDGDTESDTDLLVVGPPLVDEASDDLVWQGQLHTLVHAIDVWTGNRAALILIDADELRRMSGNKHRLLEDVRRDGVLICGVSIDGVLLSKERPQTVGAR